MHTGYPRHEQPEGAWLIPVQNPQGYDGAYWYTAHESQLTDNLVIDFSRTSDVFDSVYSPVTYNALRHERVSHIELTAEPFGLETRMIGRPVDATDWPMQGSKHHPLGRLDLRLLGYREARVRHPWCSPYYVDFVKPTIDIRENWHHRLWVRFVYPPDYE